MRLLLNSISYGEETNISVATNGTYHIGVLTGTVTGEYQAGYLGRKARERHRQAKIEECKNRITELEANILSVESECEILLQRKNTVKEEYDRFPDDTDMRIALNDLVEKCRLPS